MDKQAKNTICLWYDGDAEEAAQFYAKTFPDSSVGAVHRAPGDFPSGKQGDVLMVEFTVMGIPCLDRKSTRLNSSHSQISYAVFCLKKKKHTSDPACADSASSLPLSITHVTDCIAHTHS